MYVIDKNLLTSVAGSGDPDGTPIFVTNDMSQVDGGSPSECTASTFAADNSSGNAVNEAAAAASAQLVANAAPTVAGAVLGVLPATALNCAAGVSLLGTVGKLTGLTPVGKAVNLAACSAGAVVGALKSL